VILSAVSATGVSWRPKKETKKETKSRKMSSVGRRPRNAADAGGLRRRRRFQTSKPWLLFLAFSTYLTRIAPPGPLLASIQIVYFQLSHAGQQQEPTWDLIIDTRRKCRSWLRLDPPDDFVPEAWTKRCNEYSIFKPGLVTNKRMRVINTRYAVLQASINTARTSL